jgi:AraC family transcriptional regulator
METEVLRSLAELALAPDQRACAPLFASQAAGLLLVNALREYCHLEKFLTKPSKGGLPPWQMKRVEAFVDANIGQPISIADLERLTGLSSSHLIRSFRVSAGMTPSTYIRRRRLEAARSLLLSTLSPIEEVAAQTGFVSQSHFTTAFRTAFGQTPQVLRRTYRPMPDGEN